MSGPKSDVVKYLSASQRSALDAAIRRGESHRSLSARSARDFGRRFPASTIGKYAQRLLRAGGDTWGSVAPVDAISEHRATMGALEGLLGDEQANALRVAVYFDGEEPDSLSKRSRRAFGAQLSVDALTAYAEALRAVVDYGHRRGPRPVYVYSRDASPVQHAREQLDFLDARLQWGSFGQMPSLREDGCE